MKHFVVPLVFIGVALLGFFTGYVTSHSEDAPLPITGTKTSAPGSENSGQSDEFQPLTAGTSDFTRSIELALLHASNLHQDYELITLCANLTTDEIRKQLDALSNVGFASHVANRNYVRLEQLLIQIWAEQDPKAAADYALAHSTFLEQSHLHVGLNIWIKDDPDAALDWSSKHIPDLLNSTLSAFLDQYLDTKGTDPLKCLQAAVSAIHRGKLTPIAEQRFYDIVSKCAKHDLEAVRHIIEELPNERIQNNALALAIREQILRAPWKTRDYFQELPELGPFALSQIIVSTLTFLQKTDPAAVVHFAQGMPENKGRTLTLVFAATALKEHDPESALALIDKIADEESHNLGPYYKSWVQSDPLSALQHASKRLAKLANGSVERNYFEDTFQTDIIPALANEDRSQAVAEHFLRDANTDGSNLLGFTLAEWSQKDSEAATSWLQSLSNDAVYPAIVQGFAESVIFKDADGALAWIRTIRDPNVRQRSLVAAWRKWATGSPNGEDRAAAEQWRDTSLDLTPQERSTLTLPEMPSD